MVYENLNKRHLLYQDELNMLDENIMLLEAVDLVNY